MRDDKAEAAKRVLPYDTPVMPRSKLGSAVAMERPPTPPTYEEIAREGLIAPADDPDRWFSPAERMTATWLRHRDLDVRSVRVRMRDGLKTPDAVAVRIPITIETKTAVGSLNSIVQRIRAARAQARHVVVDLRGTGTTRAAAEAGLAAALDMYGEQLDEVAIIVTDNLAVGWSHG